MGLLAALAVTRVHVLVLEAPGRPMLRLRAEAAVRARGWQVASGAADADLLLVCGVPAGRFAGVVAGLWAAMRAPRAHRTIRATDDLPAALDEAERALASRADVPLSASATPHSAPKVASPRLELGPGAPWWPAGLVVAGEERDGLLTAVRVRVLAAATTDPDPADPQVRALAIACAEAARFLRAAGWPMPAARFERVADRVLAGRAPARQRRRTRRIAAQVQRSATFDAVLARAVPGVALRGLLLRRLLAVDDALTGQAVPVPLDALRLAARLEGARLSAVPLLLAAGWGADD